MKKSLPLALILVFGAAIAWSAEPELLPLASPSVYNENYAPLGSAGTLTRSLKRGSNRLLVGLHLGHASGRFLIDDLMAALPANASGSTFCVKLTTRDARYWSLNFYRRADAKTGSLWRLETHSKYAAELSQRYSAQDVAIRVFAAADCNQEEDSPLIAAVPPGASAADVLVLYLNAVGSRSAVKLLDKDNKPLASATCTESPRDSVIAYTEVCEVPLSGLNLAKAVKIQIALIGADATKTPIVTNIELPER